MAASQLGASGLPRRFGHKGAAISSAVAADRVISLPGWSRDLPELYSGFITIDATAERKFFYTMAVSQRDPEVDPLVLWFQGGPGCSGVGLGFFNEVGPFYASGPAGHELVLNQNSWSKVATVVFLESPAFTGFSTSEDPADLSADDERVTQDHLTFVQQLLVRFPALSRLPLYLAGQSYAGHYVPLLAQALQRDAAGAKLSGFLLGNPWTSPAHDNAGAVDHWYGQGLITLQSYKGLRRDCDFASGALWRTEGDSGLSDGCNTQRDVAFREFGHVSTYGMNAPVCLTNVSDVDAPKAAPVGDNADYDPCLGHKVERYLNRVDVQQALHVLPAEAPAQAKARRWSTCLVRRDNVTYSGASLASSMLPVYQRLHKAGVRMLVYSGDTDCVVPTVSTRSWVESLQLPVARDWHTWRNNATGQVAGHAIQYQKGFTLAVVHNAGHSAPSFQPRAMLQLFSDYIGNTAI